MKKKVFIDGSSGTTGLRIRERLAERRDIDVIVLADDVRKDVESRRAALNSADVAFLCLPDVAAVEAVSLIDNPDTVIIDTSTAHRTADGWAYGFPELAGRRAEIAVAKRIANPGCHATGFIALIEPLVRNGLVSNDISLSAFSLTGYSGGGKKMIAEYENGGAPVSGLMAGGRQYALGQSHKHLPEIVKLCRLSVAPAFCPVVAPHYSGMEVSIPIFAKDLKGGVEDVKSLYRDAYATGLVRFVENADEGGFLSSAKLGGKDTLEVSVYGNDERILLVSRFDNLGKGASGAAIQNMNIVLGVAEDTGLAV
ncbi:MAG: N-acetyl-gamma-glutamyl-phosphate reductase [Lentisphaerae bacterium]|nr:N-acetyl-gamma-glutamyl-phosphate reductase [Lentisphaerota bacterium]